MNSKLWIRLRGATLLMAALFFVIITAYGKYAIAETSIGLIMPGGDYFGGDIKGSFATYLQQSGISPGEVTLHLQSPAPDTVSRLNSIRKFLAHEMDILVIFGASAAREAAKETKKVPIVFIGASDPSEQMLTGKNVTGVTGKTSQIFLLDNIAETASLQTLGVVYKSDSMNSISQFKELRTLSEKRGFAIIAKDVTTSSTEEMADAFRNTQFIYMAVGSYPLEKTCDPARLGKPVASQSICVTGEGVVFSLIPDMEELLSEGAKLTAGIVRGKDPSELSVVPVKKISFIVNMGEAQRAGLKIPFSVLSRATEVIK